MAVTSSVGPFALLAATLRLLDFRRIEERGDDSRGSDPDCDACFHQLGPPFFVALVGIAHSILSLIVSFRPYADRQQLGRAVACADA